MSDCGGLMGRSSITVRLARSFQALPLWIFRFLEWPVVALLSRRKAKLRAIFVLALPRSGSTVTYQLLCHGLFVQYLSNVWNRSTSCHFWVVGFRAFSPAGIGPTFNPVTVLFLVLMGRLKVCGSGSGGSTAACLIEIAP